jgi:hypothetical protein
MDYHFTVFNVYLLAVVTGGITSLPPLRGFGSTLSSLLVDGMGY